MPVHSLFLPDIVSTVLIKFVQICSGQRNRTTPGLTINIFSQFFFVSRSISHEPLDLSYGLLDTVAL